MNAAELLRVFGARRGHFRFESGHHGRLWLDTGKLAARPERVRRLAEDLAARLAKHGVDAVCGPQTGGAVLAAEVGRLLGAESFAAEREADAAGGARYSLSPASRAVASGKEVAVVDDVIQAGSAAAATLDALVAAGARPVALGALLVLGSSASALAARRDLALERLAELPSELWEPAACPLCAAGAPLETPG